MGRSDRKLSLEMLQVISPSGEVKDKRLVPTLSDKMLLEAYEKMVLARIVDSKGISLQRQGRLGNYTSCLGHEATQVGSALALREEDWIFPLYRDIGVILTRGVPVADLFNRLLGNVKDLSKGRDLPNLFAWKTLHIVSNAAPIASNLAPAVGFAMAAKIKHTPLATIVFFGDGATSSSEFHVAMNFAGVYKASTIFVCENNQYAISLPVAKQTASRNIAVKAEAYGFEGVCVDGNDLLAVYKAVSEARERAIKGEGPTLVECVTYRLSDHSTSDDARRYRNEEEMKFWREKEPLNRFLVYLKKRGLWDEKKDDALKKKLDAEVNSVLKEAESAGLPEKDSMFEDVFAKKPDRLQFEFED